MSEHFVPDDERPEEEVSYEAFDDVLWNDAAEELTTIDLDALDDAIPAEEGAAEAVTSAEDTATEKLFHSMEALDNDLVPDADTPPPVTTPPALAPVKAESPAEPTALAEPVHPAPESLPAATAPTAAEATEPDAAAEPVIAYTYQVLAGLPPTLGAQVLELRATGDIDDMPPPGVALTADFRAEDADAVDSALAAWAADHLPFEVEITGVLAEVVGTQQYVAAWTLQPDDDLRAAQRDLAHLLAPLTAPAPDAPATFQVRLVIGDHVPARRYPHVIAQMQRDFEPFAWESGELILVRCRADETPGEWEIARSFA